MKLLAYTKTQLKQFTGMGWVGYVLAVLFFIVMLVAITSPFWVVYLAYHFFSQTID